MSDSLREALKRIDREESIAYGKISAILTSVDRIAVLNALMPMSEAISEALQLDFETEAASPVPAPTLDAAWQEAEAALPEGWRLRVTRADDTYEVWQASAVSPAFFDGENDNDAECVLGEDFTPAAALRALVAALATSDTETAE